MLEVGALVGADRVRRPAGHEVAIAETVVEPQNVEEVAEIVRKCEADGMTIAPLGAGRTLAELRPRPVELGVSLSRISRVVAYEPDDMTVVAGAGLTLGALNRLTAARRQRVPLDPSKPDATAVGALIGAAQAGPLRLSEGLVRDLLIGIQFVGHGGRVVRGGGRVVKNVAGYDLMKVLTGSYGTLGIVTEATFKVRPIPQLYALALAPFAEPAAAFEAGFRLHRTLPLLHLEVLSPQPAQQFGHPGKYLLLAGFGGNQPELDYQQDRIATALAPAAEIYDGERASAAYERLRDLSFAPGSIAGVLAVPPAELPRCLKEFGAEFCAHAASGVARVARGGVADAAAGAEMAARWRAIARQARGHLRLTATPPALRGRLPMFDEPPAGAMKLMRRLKGTFDPAAIFNPGCFLGGL